MATIIPATPALPGAINTTTSFAQSPSFLLEAGSYLRLLNQGSVLNFGAQSFVNRGTIFNDIDGGFPGVTRTAPNGTIRSVENSGTIVYRGLTPIANAVQVFDEITTLNNSGQIFALASGGYARAIQSTVTQFSANNSGLIAVFSATAVAIGFALPNGGTIVNTASGRILAEGDTAVAVRLDISAITGIELDNAGAIEARSITPGKLGIGVIIAFGDIVNSGTIAGDVGITGNGIFVNRGTISGSAAAISGDEFFTLTNEATGVVRGTIFGGTRDDVISTAGLIEGSLALDGGDDRVTITGTGAITGIVDLGLGNDVYSGGVGVDRVAGDNGDDTIDGQGGNDLLLGGNGNDLLTGGTGADGLYGEQGDDTIRTSGADVASGGAGNDRIEAGDHAFARVDGGVGTDTLVLAARSAPLDLSAALASGRIVGIERLALTGGAGVVVRAGDLAILDPSGSDVRIGGVAGARVDLVGTWTSGGPVILDGVSYIRWVSASGAVVVAEAVTTSVVATAPANATGLDAVAAGGPAPAPGAESGLDFTPDGLFVSNFEVFATTTIAPTDLWFTNGSAPVLQSFRDSARLEVLGTLYASNQTQASATAVFFTNLGRVSVGTAGSIVVETYGPIERPTPDFFPVNREGAYAVRDAFQVDNGGYISAYSAFGVAVALGEISIAPAFMNIPAMFGAAASIPLVTNTSVIDALSGASWAAGIVGTIDLTNSGTIAVTGAKGAVAVLASAKITNSGTIQATSGAGGAMGVLLQPGGDGQYDITNSGTIIADRAILVDPAAAGSTRVLSLANDGVIRGTVEAGGGADVVVNRGRIEGAVTLGAGNDRFDGAAGVQTARVDGGAGDDILIGGAGNDSLSGGTGNDRIEGGGGNDTAAFAGLASDYRITFDGTEVTIASDAQGTDRVTGVETFVFGTTSYTLDQLRTLPPPSSTPPFYLLVPAGGSAIVQGTGSVFGVVGSTQEVVVRDVVGRVSFDGSFNGGGDRIVLSGAASAWTVRRSGATVELSDGDTFVAVPVGLAGIDIVFADGTRSLRIDPQSGSVVVNDQPIETLSVTIGAGPQTPATTDPVNPAAVSALLVSPGNAAVANGRLTAFGSASAAETVTVAAGARVTFDGSFNAGGDTIVLVGPVNAWTASRSGATVTLTSGDTLVTIPGGTVGTTLRFLDGDRTLAIDLAAGTVRIGAQSITAAPAVLGQTASADAFGADSIADLHGGAMPMMIDVGVFVIA